MQRNCPGVGDRKCNVFMSSVNRDPHPHCARCRGQDCTRQLTCDVCSKWSESQWREFERKKKKTLPSQGATAPSTSTATAAPHPGSSGVVTGDRAVVGIVAGGSVPVSAPPAPTPAPSTLSVVSGTATASSGAVASIPKHGEGSGSVPRSVSVAVGDPALGPSSPRRGVDQVQGLSLSLCRLVFLGGRDSRVGGTVLPSASVPGAFALQG